MLFSISCTERAPSSKWLFLSFWLERTVSVSLLITIIVLTETIHYFFFVSVVRHWLNMSDPHSSVVQNSWWSMRRATGSLEGGRSCRKSPVTRQRLSSFFMETLTISSEFMLLMPLDLDHLVSPRRDSKHPLLVWFLYFISMFWWGYLWVWESVWLWTFLS